MSNITVKLTTEQVEAIRFGYTGARFKDGREDYEIILDCIEIDNEYIREENEIQQKKAKKLFLGLSRLRFQPKPLHKNPWKWLNQVNDGDSYHLGDQEYTKEGLTEILQTAEDLKLLHRIGRIIYRGDNTGFYVPINDMNTILRYMEDQDRYLEV